MSSDLLAEFDSFYRAPQDAKSNAAPASNDLSLLGGNAGAGQSGQQFGQQPGLSQWQNTQKANDGIWGGMNTLQPAANTQPNAAHQSDIWGSLSSLQQQRQPPTQGFPTSGPSNGGFTISNARGYIPQSNSGTLPRPAPDTFSSNLAPVNKPALANTSFSTPSSLPKQPVATSSSHGDILFDATEEQSAPVGDDDEFGEFETVTSESTFQSPPMQPLDLFGAAPLQSGTTQKQKDMSFAPANYDHGIMSFAPVPKPAPFEQRTSYADPGRSTGPVSKTKQDDRSKPATSASIWPEFEPQASKPSTSRTLAIPAERDDDEWGDFSPETPAATSARASSGIKSDTWAWDALDQSTERATPQVVMAPPTNIPPPSVFLTLFPILFDLPQTKLFTPVAGQTFSLKNRILSDPSTVEFLRAYLLIATVAGRILAGRKLRWKRDTILAQSMRMGPAAAGGKGGMKLTGVDKAEVTREDREAAEVARIWKDQLGRLRSAVAVSNSSTQDSSRQLAIPDVSENIHVKTQPGAGTAPKPCIICGLKRDERANKVDVDVEDSFVEWWVDHWGHRTCRNFWLEHESKLKSR
jgi:hypothetical protein